MPPSNPPSTRRWAAHRRKTWETLRGEPLFFSTPPSRKHAKVTRRFPPTSSKVLDRQSKTYGVSIESFTEKVNAYILRQPRVSPDFFVDEVGQYIADNVKLMTNLQTIAEIALLEVRRPRLGFRHGSQGNLETVIGDMEKHRGERLHQDSRPASKLASTLNEQGCRSGHPVSSSVEKKDARSPGIEATLRTRKRKTSRTLFDLQRQHGVRFRPLHDFRRLRASEGIRLLFYQYELLRIGAERVSPLRTGFGKHMPPSASAPCSVCVPRRSPRSIDAQLPVGKLATFDHIMFEGIALRSSQGDLQTLDPAGQELNFGPTSPGIAPCSSCSSSSNRSATRFRRRPRNLAITP